MSQIINKLTQINKGMPKALGFTARQSTATARMALIAIAEADGLAGIDINGADAILLRPASPIPTKTLQKAVKGLPDLPWGMWLCDNDVKGLSQAGADYAVFDLRSQVAVLDSNGKLGKILAVDASLPDSTLRVLGEVPVDAFLIADDKLKNAPLTIEQILIVQRLTAGWSKPILAIAPEALTEEDAKALWMAGVDGLVITAPPDKLQGAVAALAAILEKTGLPPRKKGRTEALVPYGLTRAEEPKGEDDEEEDDDDD